ncbi:MAG: hypothetical protein Kow00121_32580 [Elainellaceae cyanobacterium]
MLLADRYRALKPIGQGGFGRTFLAVDEAETQIADPAAAATRVCVIKQLLPRQPGNDPKAIALFREEAVRLEELGHHPQIPQLFAHLETDSAQYLVQEYINGQHLEAVLAAEGNFQERQIRDLLADLLPVLEFVHQHQVIHRDIKPENIIRPEQGDRLVLVDFGASKHLSTPALMQTGTVIGSAGYVAPEQAMGRAEFASDLYSLGVTCVHLLTGMHPFDLYSVSEDTWIWHQYLTRPVSSKLRRILERLLQKATNQRYRTASEVLQDLGVKAQSRAASGRTRQSQRQLTEADAEHRWRCVQSLTGHEGAVTAIAISPGGRIIASGSSDKSIRFWSLATGELLHTFPGRSLWGGTGHTAQISAIAFSPDGETIASGSEDGTIKWWDLDSKELIYSLPSHGWSISAIAFAAKGYFLASGSSDGLIQLWDLDHKELITNLSKHQEQVSALLFADKGRTLISSSYDTTIRLWDLKTDGVLNILNGHLDRVSAIALSPDGRTLISGSKDKTIKFWDMDYDEQRKVIAAHRKPVTCLAIHPQGQWFASGSEDCTIKLWNLETGDRLCTLRSFWGVTALAFSPDGKTLVSGSTDELIRIWQQRS